MLKGQKQNKGRGRRTLAVCLSLVMILSIFAGFPMRAQAATFAGDGTESSPYEIQTAADLAQLAILVNGSTAPFSDAGVVYKLMNNIDLSAYASGQGWVPIGIFHGTFDGNGKTISGLKTNRPGVERQGLIGLIAAEGVVKNLGVVQCDIIGSSYVGGLAGWTVGTVQNCYTTGIVSGVAYVGGLVGENTENGKIQYCYSISTVSGKDGVGGIAGVSNSSGYIRNCYHMGAVRGTDGIAGGVIGGYNGTLAANQLTDCVALEFAVDGTGYVIGFGPAFSASNSSWAGIKSVTFTLGDGFPGTVLTTADECVSAVQNIGFSTFSLNDLPQYMKGEYFPGAGTEEDPYQISTLDDLANLSFYINYGGLDYSGKCFKLMNDIDLIDYPYMNNAWAPIGTTTQFKGIFDGNGKVVKNLKINCLSSDYQGLFGQIGSGGIVKNLGVVDASVAGQNYVGGLAAVNAGTVQTCYVTGAAKGHTYTGGIAGKNSGTIQDCYSEGTVLSYEISLSLGDEYTGGIAGRNDAGTIIDCHSAADVSGSYTSSYIGGVAGGVFYSGQVENCYFTGTVSGYSILGGIVGWLNEGTITDCHSTGAVSGNSQSIGIGGVVGDISLGQVEKCYSTGPVSGDRAGIGGVAGGITQGTIKACYSTSTVSSRDGERGDSIAGIVGEAYNCAFVQNNIALGENVTGVAPLGRIIGGIVDAGGEGTFSGNYAWCYTLVNGSTVTGTPTDLNGGDLSNRTAVRAALDAIGFTDAAIPSYIKSDDATLTSVLGQSVSSATGGAGTLSSPYTYAVSVPYTVTEVRLGDIVIHDAGAAVSFFGTDSGFVTPAPASGGVSLTAGADKNIYVAVTAPDNSVVYYKITITVSAAPPAFVAVTNITGVPDTATAGTDLTLTGTVAPSDATNKTIAWSVMDAGTTGASITGGKLITTSAGTVTVTATITNGLTASSDYTQEFTITVNAAFVPVTGISGVPTTATAGTDLTLTGTVAPTDATNKTIVWSVKDSGTTGASITGGKLITTAAGSAIVKATITNGLTASSDYTQEFIITVNAPFMPVTGISGVPTTATAGTDLTLTGTVAPSDATNKTIAWSVKDAGTTGASITGGKLITTAAGSVIVTATITNGLTASSDYTQEFTITVNAAFVPVTNITGVPTTATAGTDLTLTGTVAPTDATNKAIAWSVKDAGTTGASITGGKLITTAAGSAIVKATITNGLTASSDYTQEFTITVSAAPPVFVAVTNITGVPTTATAGTDLTLTGTVAPTDATNKTIAWTVMDAGTTGASITGGKLITTAAGAVTVKATITNGLTSSSDYTQEFTITVNAAFVPVTNITGVPTTATAGTDLTLTGTVAPSDATNKTIAWSVMDAGTTDASITGGKLITTAAGSAIVKATITNGLTASSDYTQEFTITVNPAFVAVTNITGVPTTATAGTDLTLTGTVAPTDATNKTIAWSVKDAGSTGATITGGKLSTTEAGSAIVKATITNGLTSSSDYTQEFTITVNPATAAVSVSANNAAYGSVTGGGMYSLNATARLTAVPAVGYRFIRWTENGMEVSINASYSFTVKGDRTLVAVFKRYSTPRTVIPVSVSCTKTNATLYGAANGIITVKASGGNSRLYEYSITGGTSWQSTGTFTGVAAGTYTVVVRDAGNRSNVATYSVTIGQPTHVGNIAANRIPPKAKVGTAITVIPPIAPMGYTTRSVNYSSGKPSVATVDTAGNVTFLTDGKATITTKVVYQTIDKKGKIKTKTTTVKKTVTVLQPVLSVTLNKNSVTIAQKGSVKLIASIAPATASNKQVVWKSSNPKVAYVSSSGVVTGKACGTAIITCTAMDGSGVSANSTVTVTPIYPTGIKSKDNGAYR